MATKPTENRTLRMTASFREKVREQLSTVVAVPRPSGQVQFPSKSPLGRYYERSAINSVTGAARLIALLPPVHNPCAARKRIPRTARPDSPAAAPKVNDRSA